MKILKKAMSSLVTVANAHCGSTWKPKRSPKNGSRLKAILNLQEVPQEAAAAEVGAPGLGAGKATLDGDQAVVHGMGAGVQVKGGRKQQIRIVQMHLAVHGSAGAQMKITSIKTPSVP